MKLVNTVIPAKAGIFVLQFCQRFDEHFGGQMRFGSKIASSWRQFIVGIIIDMANEREKRLLQQFEQPDYARGVRLPELTAALIRLDALTAKKRHNYANIQAARRSVTRLIAPLIGNPVLIELDGKLMAAELSQFGWGKGLLLTLLPVAQIPGQVRPRKMVAVPFTTPIYGLVSYRFDAGRALGTITTSSSDALRRIAEAKNLPVFAWGN